MNQTIYTYSLKTKVCIGVFSPLGLVITVLLYGGIIYYEKWGNDPQKRSLSNMLMCYFCWTLMILVILSISIGSLRICFGPLGRVFGYLMIITRQACIFSLMLCFLEIITVKILQITYWSKMANLNDEFWSFVLGTSNGIIVTLLSTILRTFAVQIPELYYYISEGYTIPHSYQTGM